MYFKNHSRLFLSLFLFPFLLSPNSFNAQRNCGTMDDFEQSLKANPGLQEQMNRIEKHTFMNSNPNSKRSVEGVITIPVVIHVVYNHSGENISDAQIQSQIDVLNEDFRRMNGDADNIWTQASDSEIEFCLATRDAFGEQTCGITRTQTDSTKFYSKFSMKSKATGGADPWPYEDYLNIWVCDISGLLGFARFPGYDNPELYDGVVTDYRAFGTIGDLKSDFNLGRTTTHEIGHWLNLRHIWGDGDCFDDDFISDTPLSGGSNYGCDIGHLSCGSVDMVQNYMDYSDDVCMNLFTTGQKNRMRALFEPFGYRESLLSSIGCDAPITSNILRLTINFDDYPADISWNIKNGTGTIIAYDEDFDEASYAGQSVYYDFEYPDAVYTFTINDSYGDGICCNEGAGSYEFTNQYRTILSSDGQFQSGETLDLILNDGHYRFIGPGTNWNFAGNWNKGKVPPQCYTGAFTIEEICNTNGQLSLNSTNDVLVKTGAQLIVNN